MLGISGSIHDHIIANKQIFQKPKFPLKENSINPEFSSNFPQTTNSPLKSQNLHQQRQYHQNRGIPVKFPSNDTGSYRPTTTLSPRPPIALSKNDWKHVDSRTTLEIPRERKRGYRWEEQEGTQASFEESYTAQGYSIFSQPSNRKRRERVSVNMETSCAILSFSVSLFSSIKRKLAKRKWRKRRTRREACNDAFIDPFGFFSLLACRI